ncbi:hypothetical protein [Streptomyces sp. NPDC059861]|uniref:hypothetical protein n=1 Tax=Streptomyces sp. NPDC059861 TaxID=3346974 RepID=UPI00365C23A5
MAYAADGGVSVSPATPAPGGELGLRVTGCTGKAGVASSAAFVTEARLSGLGGTLTGQTRIRSALRPERSYEVKVTCAGADGPKSITTPLTLTDGSAASPGVQHPSGHASPIAPVKAGGGGTAHLAAGDEDARATGPNAGHAVTGLVLAGAAGVAVKVLGGRRSRRTG